MLWVIYFKYFKNTNICEPFSKNNSSEHARLMNTLDDAQRLDYYTNKLKSYEDALTSAISSTEAQASLRIEREIEMHDLINELAKANVKYAHIAADLDIEKANHINDNKLSYKKIENLQINKSNQNEQKLNKKISTVSKSNYSNISLAISSPAYIALKEIVNSLSSKEDLASVNKVDKLATTQISSSSSSSINQTKMYKTKEELRERDSAVSINQTKLYKTKEEIREWDKQGKENEFKRLKEAAEIAAINETNIENRRKMIDILTTIYEKYNPSKIVEIPYILGIYEGREKELLDDLDKKFNISRIHVIKAAIRFSGGMYEGDIVDGVPNGEGTLRWIDSHQGQVYTGEWKDGVCHGKGKHTWPSGASFEGNWVNGVIQGRGIYHYADGSIYQGDLRNGKSHGYGIYRYSDGRIYEGEFKEDKQHGKGIYLSNKGKVIYEGEYKFGEKVA